MEKLTLKSSLIDIYWKNLYKSEKKEVNFSNILYKVDLDKYYLYHSIF